MSEKFETRGEIGHSLAGLRDQLAFQSKVLGAAVIMAVVALGLLFNQYSGLSLKFADLLASNARNETKIASMDALIAEMEGQLKQARAETAATKRAVDRLRWSPMRAEQQRLPRLDRRQDGQLQAGTADRRSIQVDGLDLRHRAEGMSRRGRPFSRSVRPAALPARNGAAGSGCRASASPSMRGSRRRRPSCAGTPCRSRSRGR